MAFYSFSKRQWLLEAHDVPPRAHTKFEALDTQQAFLSVTAAAKCAQHFGQVTCLIHAPVFTHACYIQALSQAGSSWHALPVAVSAHPESISPAHHHHHGMSLVFL